jgi:hypothetical protein
MGRSKVAGTHETAVEKGSGSLHILDGLETVYACIKEMNRNCSGLAEHGAAAFVHKT